MARRSARVVRRLGRRHATCRLRLATRLMVFNRMSKRVDPIGCFGGVDSTDQENHDDNRSVALAIGVVGKWCLAVVLGSAGDTKKPRRSGSRRSKEPRDCNEAIETNHKARARSYLRFRGQRGLGRRVHGQLEASLQVARGGVVLGGIHRSSGRSLRRRRRLPDEELASRTPAAELPGTTADSPRPAVRRLLAGPETQRRRLPEVGGRRLLAGLAQAGHRREAAVVGDGFGTEAAAHWGEARGGRERDRRVEEEIGSIWTVG
ncbi:hypothetical protein OsI_37867 [Oryza sativa Indica Group]|uniref:Uncharacterized protein n=1 Tax=Oryza sativa subsp. indica TaxID=39946 RepID=B8BNQ0_ORYSI|nr:hypothetical protein OsI_37867 [Oryza sativa Indica Group]